MTTLSFRKLAHHLLAVITLLMVIADILMLISTKYSGDSDSSSYLDLSDSWYVSGNAGLSEKPISGEIQLKKNTSFFVYIVIPEEAAIKSRTCMSFISYACAFDLMVGNEIIYSYGKDRLYEHKMIPRRVHYVSIPESAEEKDVKIVFISGKDGASINPDSSYFGDIEVLSKVFIRKRAYAFFLCAFLITYGFLLITLCLLMGRHLNVAFSTISQGLLLIDLGMYISCYNDTFYYILRNDVACTFIEYLSLFSLPFFMQMVIISNRRKYTSPIHIAVTVFDAAVIAVGVILHVTGIRAINTMGPYIHTIMVIHGFYSFLWIRHILNREKKELKSYLFADAAATTIDFGLMALMSLSVLNLFLWSRGIFHLDFLNTDVKGNFIILGSLIFSGCVTLGYFFHGLGIAHEQEIKTNLTNAAYTDELTGIKNRAFCDYMVGMWKKDNVIGSVITLDLDGLKKINDSSGHEAGDKYIISFASIMRQTLPENISVCRTGGDEFVIMLKDYDLIKAQEVQREISDAVEAFNNSSKSDMKISYSDGVACSLEVEGGNVRDVCRLSDQRMYEVKEEHHRQGKGGRS